MMTINRQFRTVALLTFLLVGAGSVHALGAVAKLVAASGTVEMRSGPGVWKKATAGMELSLKDAIRTGSDAVARLEFRDGDAESGASPTLVDLDGGTEVSIEQFAIARSAPKRRTGLLDVLKGTLRAITKGWRSGSVFSVRAGVTVCGIRGSEVMLKFDPDAGTASFTSLSGQMFVFSADSLAAAVLFTGTISQSIARTGTVPAGVQSFAPGQEVAATQAAGTAASTTLKSISQAQAQRLAVALQKIETGVAQAIAEATTPEGDTGTTGGGSEEGVSGSSDTSGEGGKDGAGGDGGEATGEAQVAEGEGILQAISTEVAGSSKLNGPVSEN
jgi:hypothetical protein